MNANVMIGWVFWFLLIEMGSLSYLIKKFNKAGYLFPIFIYVLVFETVIDGHTYANNHATNYSSETIKALDDRMVEQIVTARKAGETSVTVYIPLTGNSEWPISVANGGGRISRALFRHGIIDQKMAIYLVQDGTVNEEFHLD